MRARARMIYLIIIMQPPLFTVYFKWYAAWHLVAGNRIVHFAAPHSFHLYAVCCAYWNDDDII